MGRYENEDISHLDLPDAPKIETTFYMENGDILDDEEFNKVMAECEANRSFPPTLCAKHITNYNTKMQTFFVLCAGSNLYDPHNKGRLRVRAPWKLRRIKKTFFDLYLKFLRTGHKTFLYQAERGI